MLSGRAGVEDRIAGLNAGADDYLAKPFSPRELHARLKRMIKRVEVESQQASVEVGELRLDLAAHEARRQGVRLELTPTTWKILVMLAKASPLIVTRREFEQELWQGQPPQTDTLRSQIHNLRKVVDRPFASAMLETVPGEGFRLMPT